MEKKMKLLGLYLPGLGACFSLPSCPWASKLWWVMLLQTPGFRSCHGQFKQLGKIG